MNEYMIRFTDGTIKHIKADSCKFTVTSNVPMVNFFKKGQLFYAINLTSISAIRFPYDDGEDPEANREEVNTG